MEVAGPPCGPQAPAAGKQTAPAAQVDAKWAVLEKMAKEASVDWTRVDALSKDLRATDKGATACADAIEEELGKLGLVYEVELPPEQLGPHPRNRKIMICEIAPLMEDISFGGFSAARCTHALACEERPGLTEIEDYNIALAAGTPALAPVHKGQKRFGTLACSHMNLGFCSINARAECSVEALAEDGKWSIDKIAARPFSEQLLKALRQGIRWKVLRWLVYHERPELLELLSTQRNMAQHTGRVMSEAAVTQELFRLASADETPDWPRIKRLVGRSRPPCAEIIDDLAYFVLRRSGGRTGVDITEWADFWNRFAGSKKIPGAVYTAAAAIDHHRLSIACLKALATCPRDRVEQGVCKWFGARDITNLGKEDCPKKNLVALAEEVLEESRSLLAAAGIGREDDEFRNELCEQYCFLDCGIARVLLGKVEITARVVDPGVRILDPGGYQEAAYAPSRPLWAHVSGKGRPQGPQEGLRACFSSAPCPVGASVDVRGQAEGVAEAAGHGPQLQS